MPPRKKAAARTKAKKSSTHALSQEADSQREGRVPHSASVSNPAQKAINVEAKSKELTAYQKKTADNKIAWANARKAARENKKRTLTKFTLFPKLPPELRRMVWRFALPPKDRIIPLEYLEQPWPTVGAAPYTIDKYQYRPVYHPPHLSAHAFISPKNPGMLSACWESRTEYLQDNPKVIPHGEHGRIYYDPAVTPIFNRHWYLPHLVDEVNIPSWVADTEVLSFDCEDIDWMISTEQFKATFKMFKSLKKVIAIVSTHTWRNRGGTRQLVQTMHYQKLLEKMERVMISHKNNVDMSYNIPEIVFRDLSPKKHRVDYRKTGEQDSGVELWTSGKLVEVRAVS